MKQGSLTNEDVLRTEIPWPSFMNAGILSKEQLEMMYQLDKQPLETQIKQFSAVRSVPSPSRGPRCGAPPTPRLPVGERSAPAGTRPPSLLPPLSSC